MVRRLAQRRLLLPIAALALSLLSCGREVTGPENGIFRNRIAMLAFEPVFTGPMAAVAGAGDAVPFEKVRVVLRALDGTIVKDTMVDFPSDVDEVSLALTIPIPQDAPAAGLPLTVAMAYVNAAGDTVFRGGPNPLVARPVGSAGAGTPVTVPVEYDGTGKDAARVAITPKTGTGVAGQTLAFSATAFDASDAPIANTPFVFSTLDPTRATVDPVTGLATWLPVRGTARVIAELPNGDRADTATFTVALPAAKLVLGSGGAQVGAVNAPLADTIVVRTLASDDVPVEGVVVTFAVATGAGTLSVLEDTSDANGDVKTVWTLGAPLGAQTITATSAGLTGSPLTITATSQPATPVRLEITQAPSAGVAGVSLAPALSVIARDAFENIVTGFADTATVSVLGADPASLTGTSARVAVAGIATFDDVAITAAGDVQLVVSSGSLASDTTAAFRITAAAASRLAILSQPTVGVDAGVTFAVDVEARDAFGNRDSSFTGNATIAVRSGAVGATLGGVTTRAMVAGGVSFTALTLDRAGTYELEVSAPGLTTAVTAAFDILTGAASRLAIASAPSGPVAAGSALGAIVVRAENAFGEATLFGDSLRVVVVDGPVGGGIIAGDSVVLADSAATFGGLAFDVAGSYTLEFRGAGLDSVRSAAIAIVAGDPVSVTIVGGDGQTGVVGSAPLAPLAIAVRDAYGNGVAGVATLWFTSSGSSAALDSTDVTTDAAGIARTTLRFGETVESFAVTASAGDAGSVDFTLTAIAGDAVDLVATAEPGAAIAGAPIGPLTVTARDAFANLANAFVGDVTVAVDSGPAGASLGGTTTVTAIAGSAVFADLTLDRAGDYRLRVQSAGLADTVTTTFTVAAAALADILLVGGDAQTDTVGATLLTPLSVRAVDAFGNPVAGAGITWSVTGDVSIGEPSTTTGATGEAVAVATLGTTAGAASVTVALDALPDSSVTFTLTALGGTATQLVVAAAPDTVTASVPATIVIHALDMHGNVSPAFTEDVTITAVDAVGPANGVTTVAAVGGFATFDAITFDVLGAYFLEAAASGGLSVNFELRAIAGDASDLSIVSGDGQTLFTGFQLDAPIVLQLADANGFPVEGDTVFVTVATGGGVIGDLQDSLALVTDGLGQVSVIWTLGLELGTQTLSARTATLGPITLTATALQSVANVVWTGALSSEASNAANWRNGVTPAPTDSVLVPAGAPNYPTLATTTTYARLTVEDGASLNLGPYTLTVTRDIRAPQGGGIFTTNGGSVTADSAGTVVGQFPALTVDGDFQTAGLVVVDGSVTVQNNSTFSISATDSLHVGSALSTFGGGAVNQVGGSAIYVGSGGLFLDGGTSTFGAGGRLHLLGNLFTQQTAAPTAFVADSAHELYLLPGATQDIYLFDNDVTPDGACTASCLGTVISLRAAGQGGIRFLTDVMARGGFQVDVDSIGGNPTYVVAGAPSTLRAPIGGAFRRFGFTGSFDVNAFSADTLVAFGSGYLPANLAIPTIVAGQYLINAGHDAGLIVDGVLGVEGAGAAVNGSLRTRGNGFLAMTDAGDSLVVTGELRFEGSAEAGQMTAGAIEALGDVYVGASAALVADSGHVLRFTDGNGHSLTVLDATTRLGSVLLTNNSGVTVTGDTVRVAGDLTVLGIESQFANIDSALVEIGGRLVMPEGSGLSFTTTVLTGTDAIATPRVIGTLALRGPTTLSDTLRVAGALQVESGGALVLNGQRVEVDSLFTSGSGTITMANAADTLTVYGTAIFNGGASVLTDGRLRLAGRIDGNGAAFQGTPTHTTEFFGGASQQVGFGNVGFGAGQAQFGRVELNKTGGAPFSSTAVYMNGQLVTVAPAQQWGGTGAPRSLNVRGADIAYLSLPNQTLVIADGADVTRLDSLRFTGFEAGATQLRIERSGGTVNLVAPMFDTTAATPIYLSASDVLDDADSLTIQVSDPRPTVNGGLVQALNGARILGWGDFAALVWTAGAGNELWTEPTNWAQGRAPTSSDSVVVSGSFDFVPTITANTTVRALTWSSFQPITLNAALTITGSVSGGVETPAISCGTSGSLVFATADSLFAAGRFDCPVHVSDGRTVLGGSLQVDTLIIDGTGELHVRGADFVNVTGDLRTLDNGTLRMEGTSEAQVSVSRNATFASTPTPGSLTGGRLVLYGDFVQQTSPTAFAAAAAHETYFVGAQNQLVRFENPDPINGSHFGRLGVEPSASEIAVQLQSDVYAEGELVTLSGTAVNLAADGGHRLLRVRGVASNSDGSIEFVDVRLEIVDGGSLDSQLYGFRFVGFTAVGTPQLRIARPAALVTLNSFLFDETATSPLYLQVEDTDALGQTLVAVTLVGTSPLYHGGAVETIGGASILGWDAEPQFVWISTFDGNWTNDANWSTGVAPTSSSSVTIPATATVSPSIVSGPVTVRRLVIEADTLGLFLASGVTLTVTDLMRLQPNGQGAFCSDNTARLVIGGNATAVSGRVRGCDVVASGGTASITDSLVIDQALALEGDHALNVNGGVVRVGDSLVVRNSARLLMQTPTDQVISQGTATFAGGASVLSAGVLRVDEGFTQSSATSTASFAPSGTHRTVLGDSTDLVGLDLPFEIRFDSPVDSWFNELYVAGGWYSIVGTARARGRIDVRDFRQFQGGTLVADSGLYAPFGELAFQRVSIAGPFGAGGVFSADTVEFRGPVGGDIDQSLPGWVGETQIPYQTVVVTGPNVVMRDLGGPYAMGKLDVPSGSLTFGEGINVLADTATLAVRGSGTAIWATGVPAALTFDSVYVGTSATLAPTSGSLSLTHFVQEGVANFRPSGSFSVTKNLDGVVSFADPVGAYFHNLFLSTNATATLRSDITVNGLLTRNTGGTLTLQSDELSGATRALTANGGLSFLDNRDGGTLMRRVRLHLTGSYASSESLAFNNVRFELMDPDAGQPYLLTQHGGGIAATWSNIVFDTPVNSALYFQWDAPDDGSSIEFAGASPAVGCLVGTCVQGQTAPDGQVLAATWTGDVSPQWTDPGNWQGGILPNAETVVTVDPATFAPEIADGTQLGGLIVSAGAEARIPAVGTITVFGDVDIQGTLQGLDGSSTLLMRPAATSTLATSGEGVIDANLTIDRGIGQVDGVVQLSGNVTMIALASTSEVTVDGGTLDLNGFSFTTPGNFWTTRDGRLRMDAAAPTLSVGGSATFSGASTQGLLTTGELRVAGNLVQDSAVTHASFQSTGSHDVVFVGTGTSIISFNSSDSTTGSRIANLRNEKVDGLLWLQNSDLYVDTVVGGWTADFQIAEPGSDFYTANLYVLSRFEPLSQPFGLIVGFSGRVFVLPGIPDGCGNTSLLINQGDSANLTPSECAWIP